MTQGVTRKTCGVPPSAYGIAARNTIGGVLDTLRELCVIQSLSSNGINAAAGSVACAETVEILSQKPALSDWAIAAPESRTGVRAPRPSIQNSRLLRIPGLDLGQVPNLLSDFGSRFFPVSVRSGTLRFARSTLTTSAVAWI